MLIIYTSFFSTPGSVTDNYRKGGGEGREKEYHLSPFSETSKTLETLARGWVGRRQFEYFHTILRSLPQICGHSGDSGLNLGVLLKFSQTPCPLTTPPIPPPPPGPPSPLPPPHLLSQPSILTPPFLECSSPPLFHASSGVLALAVEEGAVGWGGGGRVWCGVQGRPQSSHNNCLKSCFGRTPDT
jgi:hypothetical protein